MIDEKEPDQCDKCSNNDICDGLPERFMKAGVECLDYEGVDKS